MQSYSQEKTGKAQNKDRSLKLEQPKKIQRKYNPKEHFFTMEQNINFHINNEFKRSMKEV